MEIVIHNQHSTLSTFWLHRLTIEQCTPQRQQNLDTFAIVLPGWLMINYQQKKTILKQIKEKKKKKERKMYTYQTKKERKTKK